MIFDRITLIKAYRALKLVQDNDGEVKNILFNKTSKYGTRKPPRFQDLKALKEFINQKYPYVIPSEYTCITGLDESIWTLLAFEIHSRKEDLIADIITENNKRRDIKSQAVSKYITFVNNIKGQYRSQKKEFQNSLTRREIDNIFRLNTEIDRLFKTYECRPYIENSANYLDPAMYIEILKNNAYNTVINKYYKPTRGGAFPNQVKKFN